MRGGVPAGGLVKDPDLFQFFLDRVETAVSHQGAAVSANTVYYLTQLLAEQGHAEDTREATFVELRQRAVSAPPPQAVAAWKRIGDQSLLVTGYFRETMSRRRITRAYAEAMGASAYGVLARVLAGPRGGFGEIFGELADRWDTCSNVLAEVRDEAADRSDTDVVRLYEEWLQSGSPRVAERLRELGVIPMRNGGVS